MELREIREIKREEFNKVTYLIYVWSKFYRKMYQEGKLNLHQFGAALRRVKGWVE